MLCVGWTHWVRQLCGASARILLPKASVTKIVDADQRVADNPKAKRPVELDAALAAVTTENGEPQFDPPDDDQRQALHLYETASKPGLADLAQQDFLASQQLSVI